MDSKGALSREEVLSGLGGRARRQANSIFSLIQARAARLILENRSLASPLISDVTLANRNNEYLQAIASGKSPEDKPTIQEMERTAPNWASLIPDNSAVRAALAHKFGSEYAFTAETTPRLGAALGLTDPSVSQSFKRAFKSPVSAIYEESLSFSERVRWLWNRLSIAIDSLPAFWVAFGIVIAGYFGPGILALPIAYASLGPLLGAGVLIGVGIINVVTAMYVAEACVRHGAMSYGSAYIGRLVHDFLGRYAAILLRIGLFAYCCLVLFAFYNGFASAMFTATGVPNEIWPILLFFLSYRYISGRAISITVAATFVISVINLSAMFLLALLTFYYLDWQMPTGTEAIDIANLSALSLVFGTTLYAFAGQIAVSNAAQITLRRDPSGRSLILGTIAGTTTLLFVYLVFVVAVNGTLPAHVLVEETGTVLDPLSRAIGPSVNILSLTFVLLGLGMGNVAYAMTVYNMTHEAISEWMSRFTNGYEANTGPNNQLASILALPDEERRVVLKLLREELEGQGSGAIEPIARSLQTSEDKVGAVFDRLLWSGLIVRDHGNPDHYRTRFRLRGTSDTLEHGIQRRPSMKRESSEPRGRNGLLNYLVNNLSARFLVPFVPLVAIFLASEWVLIRQSPSFAEPIALTGALVAPILAGVLPALLYLACRRTGVASDARVIAPAGWAGTAILILILFMASLLMHGLLIWSEPIARLCATAIFVLLVVMIFYTIRSGAFKQTVNVEIRRHDVRSDTLEYRISEAGNPLSCEVVARHGDAQESQNGSRGSIGQFSKLAGLRIKLPQSPVRKLRIAAHTVTPENDLIPIPASLLLTDEDGTRELSLVQTNGWIRTSTKSPIRTLQFAFAGSAF